MKKNRRFFIVTDPFSSQPISRTHVRTTQDPRYQRPPLRQRFHSPGTHAGVHPDGHVGALPEDAWQPGRLRLRRRRPRFGDHAPRRARGHHLRATDRRRARRAHGRLRRLPGGLRQLPLDPLGREPRAVQRDLPETARRRAHRHPPGDPVLRPGKADVPRRPLHQGHLPEVRHRRPVRRQLRGLRRDLRPDRTEGPEIGDLRRHPGAQGIAALLLQAAGLRGHAQAMDPQRRPSGVGGQQARRMAGQRPPAVGHLARRAVLRLRDSRRSRQVLLRLAGRANRLHGQLQEPLHAAPRAGLRRVLGQGLQRRAVPLHRQGHRQLPRAVLAGHARRRRLPQADRAERARLPDRERPEDVQVARHLRQGAHLPRPPGPGIPALLLRLQARPRRRGPRPEPRGLRAEGQLRPGRQGRQYRQPLRRLHPQGQRRRAGRRRSCAGAARRLPRGRTGHRRGL